MIDTTLNKELVGREAVKYLVRKAVKKAAKYTGIPGAAHLTLPGDLYEGYLYIEKAYRQIYKPTKHNKCWIEACVRLETVTMSLEDYLGRLSEDAKTPDPWSFEPDHQRKNLLYYARGAQSQIKKTHDVLTMPSCASLDTIIDLLVEHEQRPMKVQTDGIAKLWRSIKEKVDPDYAYPVLLTSHDAKRILDIAQPVCEDIGELLRCYEAVLGLRKESEEESQQKAQRVAALQRDARSKVQSLGKEETEEEKEDVAKSGTGPDDDR